MAWMVPFLPGEFAFVSLASNFPESPAYVARVREMMVDRGGDNYAIIPAAVDKRRCLRVRQTLRYRARGLPAKGVKHPEDKGAFGPSPQVFWPSARRSTKEAAVAASPATCCSA